MTSNLVITQLNLIYKFSLNVEDNSYIDPLDTLTLYIDVDDQLLTTTRHKIHIFKLSFRIIKKS